MRILYDSQIFSIQRFGGISNYFSKLMAGALSTGVEVATPFRFHVNGHLPPAAAAGKIHIPEFRGSARLCRLLNRFPKPAGEIDIHHATYYDTWHIGRYGDAPLVTTIHDMIPELFPEQFSGEQATAKGQFIERSSAVICVSQSTRNDLVRLTAVDPTKVHVVYHGIDLREAAFAQQVSNLPERFFLYVGSRATYKNFDTLLDAFSRFKARADAPWLLCVGGGVFTPPEAARIKELGINRIRHLTASDAELRFLFRKAIAFVYPSRYEGFGIPILEAFAQRCPAILANASCFPEIARDAALYFDPSATEALFETMARIEKDASARNQLIGRGASVVRDYPDSKCCQESLAVYQQTLGLCA